MTHFGNMTKIQAEYFKQLEGTTGNILDPMRYTVLRIDGNNFHHYTSMFRKPYDIILHCALDCAYLKTMNQLFRGDWSLIYSQSDEVTIILDKKIDLKSQLPFKGKKEKINSITPSLITSNFLISLQEIVSVYPITKILEEIYDHNNIPSPTIDLKKPMAFDCRIFQTNDLENIQRVLSWRRIDAINNSKAMFAQIYLGKKQVNKMKNHIAIKNMKSQCNFDWKTLPTFIKRGTLFITPLEQHQLSHEFHEPCPKTKQYKDLIYKLITP